MAEAEVREMLRGFLTAGVRPGEVAALVAEASGWSRRDVYRLLLDIRRCGNIDDA